MKKVYISLAIVMATQITFNAFSMKTSAPEPAGHKDKKRRTSAELHLPLGTQDVADFAIDLESGAMDKLFLEQYNELRKIENPTREDIAAQSNIKEILCGILGYRFNRNDEPVKKMDGKQVAIVMNEPAKNETTGLVFKEKTSSTSSE